VEVGGEREVILETATAEGRSHREERQEEEGWVGHGGAGEGIPQSWVAPTKRPNRYVLKPLLPPRGGVGVGGKDKGDRKESAGRVLKPLLPPMASGFGRSAGREGGEKDVRGMGWDAQGDGGGREIGEGL
jgi:hypothetical protein